MPHTHTHTHTHHIPLHDWGKNCLKPNFIIDFLTTLVENYDKWYIDEAQEILNSD